MHLVVFEDNKFEQFYPITLSRPACELRCGITSLLEKIKTAFPADSCTHFMRDYLAPTFKKRHPEDTVNDMPALRGKDLVLVNSRALLVEKPSVPDGEGYVESDGDLAYARISQGSMKGFKGQTIEGLLTYVKETLKSVKGAVKLAGYLWNLIEENPAAIGIDFKSKGLTGIQGSLGENAVVYGDKDQVYVGPKAEIHPLVCLDTRGGPVFIDEGAEVQAFTRIEGPCYVGKNSLILGPKIREGCSIGPTCRVGGEVEESIIHGHSNKYHDGFLGHSYIGEWVNLGAQTTNSDLKNDYGSITVFLNGKPTDTGSNKVGCFVGDHTKTGINTALNTGTYIGALCIIVAGGGVLPKYIPTGTWFLNNMITKGFGFKKLLGTAEMVMSRRKVEFSSEDADLLKTVYELQKPIRNGLIKKQRGR